MNEYTQITKNKCLNARCPYLQREKWDINPRTGNDGRTEPKCGRNGKPLRFMRECQCPLKKFDKQS